VPVDGPTVEVRSPVKLGNLTLPVNDLTVPVPGGAPVTASRTYDSQRANVDGGLGYGWELDSLVPAVTTTAKGYHSTEDTPSLAYGDLVYLRLPGGGRQAFYFVPVQRTRGDRSLQGWVGDAVPYRPAFLAADGSSSTLTVDDADDRVLYQVGGVYVDYTGQGYNPATFRDHPEQYKLTTEDGTTYTFDAHDATLKTSTDALGNTAIYGNDGNVASTVSGVSYAVTLTGSGDHAVAQAVRTVGDGPAVPDPSARVVYTFDDAHNLIGVKTAAGIRSTYVYADRLLTLAGGATHAYAVVRNAAGQVWDRDSHAFVTEVPADAAHYAFPLAGLTADVGDTAPAWFTASLDGGDLIGAGQTLSVTYYDGLADTPALGTDPVLGAETRAWAGPQPHYLIGVVDARGVRTLTAEYDAGTRELTRLADTAGNAATLASGDPSGGGARQQATGPTGGSTQSEYNDQGDVVKQVQTVRDQTGKVLRYVVVVRDVHYGTPVDDDGNTHYNVLDHYYESAPFVVDASRSADLNLTAAQLAAKYLAKDASGHPLWASKQDYDPETRVLSSTSTLQADGTYRTTTYGSYVLGRPKDVTSPDGVTTTNDYDAATGLLNSTTTKVGGVVQSQTSFTYTDGAAGSGLPKGLLLETRRDSVLVAANTYYGSADTDVARGQLPGHLASTTTYASATPGDSTKTHYLYDASGRVIRTYSLWANPVSGLADRWTVTTTDYDAAGRVASTTQAVYEDDGDGTLGLDAAQVDAHGYALITETLCQPEQSSGTTQLDALGNVTHSTDAYGGVTYTTYNLAGQAVRTVYPDGTETRTAYDALGRVQWQTDRYYTGATGTSPADNATTALGTLSAYDDQGRLVGSTRYGDVLVRLDADASVPGVAGLAKATVAAHGEPLSSTSTAYDALGRVVESTNAAGLTTGAIYYSDGTPHYTGRVVIATGTPPGRSQIFDAARHAYLVDYTTYAYGHYDDSSPPRRYDSVTDALDHETRTYKDAMGRVTLTTYGIGTPEKSFTETRYSDDGRHVDKVAQRKSGDPELVTGYDYDEAGRLIAVTLPAVDIPDPAGSGTITVRPRYEYGYDAYGNQTYQITNAYLDGDTIVYLTKNASGIDEVAGSRSVSGPMPNPLVGEVTRFTYDHLGRRTSRTLPTGQLTEWSFYDDSEMPGTDHSVGLGQLAFSVDFEGRVTRYWYDNTPEGGGRLVEQDIYPASKLGTLTITAATTAADIADKMGGPIPAIQTLNYHYDPMGRQGSVSDKTAGRTWHYVYDAEGRQTQVKVTLNQTGDPVESVVNYEYDALGRLARTYTGDPDPDLASAAGDGKAVTDTRYGYDEYGRLEIVAVYERGDQPIAPAARETTSYFYDGVGNLDYTVQADGVTSDYTYDALNRLTELDHFVDGDGDQRYQDGGSDVLVAKYRYDLNPDGTKRQATETDDQFNHRTSYWSYDADGRLISEAMDVGGVGSTAEDYVRTYRYDLTGNRLAKSTQHAPSSAALDAFLADPAGFTPDETITYTYDGNDRLLTETDDAADPADDTYTVYDYTSGTRDTTAQTSKTIYAGLGDQGTTLKSKTTFSYDAQGRLSGATIDADGDGTAETSLAYKYGPDGVRIEQKETEDGGVAVTHAYVVDANNPTGYAQVLEERADGTLARTYTLGLDVVAQTAPPSAADGTTLPAGVAAGDPLTLLYDGHGSTRALLDAAHALVQRFAYDAYGNQLTGASLTGASAALTSLLYSGEQFDAELATQYLRGRPAYDPATGRFTTADPIGGTFDPGDFANADLYAYVHNDPVNFIDPTGLFGIVEMGMNMFTIMQQYGSRAVTAYNVYDKANTVYDASVLVAKFITTGSLDPIAATLMLTEFLPLGKVLETRIAGKFLTGATETLENIYKRSKGYMPLQKMSELVGEVGAGLVAKAHNWTPTNFPRKYHGIESVFEDAAGNLVILEAKGGAADLSKGQMSQEWIEKRIEKLINSADPLEVSWGHKLDAAKRSRTLKGGVVWTSIDHTAEKVGNPQFLIKDWDNIGGTAFDQ
jgi:RHS repeat-associated protein